MTDVAPASKAAAQDEATRGRPHYDKLRRDLKAAIDRKRTLDTDILSLENEIARTEDEYLETTSAAGNLIRGFDNYMKAGTATGGPGAATSGPGTATRRKGGISDADRIFSRSSVGWTAPEDTANGAASLKKDEGKGSGRDTPGSQGAGTKAGNKSKKKSDKDDDDERPHKRGKVTWGRD